MIGNIYKNQMVFCMIFVIKTDQTLCFFYEIHCTGLKAKGVRNLLMV